VDQGLVRLSASTLGGGDLEGPQIGVATPIFKRHDANTNDPNGFDLVNLSTDFVPDTAFVRVRGREAEFRQALDKWINYDLPEASLMCQKMRGCHIPTSIGWPGAARLHMTRSAHSMHPSFRPAHLH